MRDFPRRRHCRQLLIALLLNGSALSLAHGDGLEEALQATLRNHPAVAGQQAEVAARQSMVVAARSQRLPTLSAQAQQYAQSNRSVLSGEDLSHPATLRLRQPVWAFGRINSSIAVASAEVSTERADLLRVNRQLLEDTAVAYAEVRGRRQQVDVARQNVAQLAELHGQIERRVEGQLASSADARLAATRLAQAQALFELAVSEWDGATDDLASLTQTAGRADRPVPAELLVVEESPDLIADAVDQSAEILVKRERLELAEAEVGRARTSLRPTIFVQAERFYDQPGLRDDSQISVVFEASLDGLGMAARGRTGEAVAGRVAATQDLAAGRLALTRDLKRLLRNRRLQGDLIELQTRSLSELESLLASYQRQFETGTKSWLDLLNIQRELFEQKRTLAQAQSDWQIHSLRLLARIGGLDDLAGLQEHQDD
ncbi:MAG: TolC family protein [Pseudomonadales bacterium]